MFMFNSKFVSICAKSSPEAYNRFARVIALISCGSLNAVGRWG